MKISLKYISLAILFLMACGKQETRISWQLSDFFPMRVGAYYVYAISEVQTSPIDIKTEISYQIKTVISDSIPDVGGSYTFVMARYRRPDSNAAWQYMDTWSAREGEWNIIMNEGNVPYVKLSLPVVEGNRWNGNAYNNLPSTKLNLVPCDEPASGLEWCDYYQFQDVDKPVTLTSGLNFEHTISVMENDVNDLIIGVDIRKLVFAKDVGLIFREINYAKYCTSNNTCLGKKQVEDGLYFSQTLIEHGRL